MELIRLDWYIQDPIDFEHKQLILFAYLHEVDQTFLSRIVSPHLLHLEKLERELTLFREAYNSMKDSFDKERYKWFDNPKLIGEHNQFVDDIVEIVDFSIPQIKTRIDHGYRIFDKYGQILY